MNLRDLKYITAVADLRNFSQAAEQCHVSQPTLSGQIKKLEEQLGVAIFERNNKHVMLTDIGAQIVQSARRILHEADVINELAENAHDPLAGTLRLGAFPTLATYIFPSLVPKITRALPKIRLVLQEEKTESLLELLRQGKLDAALLALPIEDDFFISEPLFDDVFYLATPSDHPLAKEKEISLDMLLPHPLLLLNEGHCLRDQALEVCAMHGLLEEADVRATGLETLRQMVKAGTGITIIPEIAKRSDDGITYTPFTSPVPKRTIGLVWRKTTSRTELMHTLTTFFT